MLQFPLHISEAQKQKTYHCLNSKPVLPNCPATGIWILLITKSFTTNTCSTASLYILDNGPNRMFMYFAKRKHIYAHAHCMCVCTLIRTCFIQLCHVLNYSSWPAIIWTCHCKFENQKVLHESVEPVALCFCQSAGTGTDVTRRCSALWSAVCFSTLAEAHRFPLDCPSVLWLVGPTRTLKTAVSPAM